MTMLVSALQALFLSPFFKLDRCGFERFGLVAGTFRENNIFNYPEPIEQGLKSAAVIRPY
jgi:hypothetical protein